MTRKERAQIIAKHLDVLFPETPIPLQHKDPYTLLIAVLLSAQCTDDRVNQVTPNLFALADTPEKMTQSNVDDIRVLIRPCGLSPTKSKAIHRLSVILLERHQGKVPENYKALEALPGVGHKTASVVMSQAYGHDAFPVDTHIHRLAKKWRLTKGKDVVQTEKDLKKVFPKNTWNKRHLQIIFYGRLHSPARGKGKCPDLITQEIFGKES